MEKNPLIRPGRMIFLGGVVLVVTSTALGMYLASLGPAELPEADWHLPAYDQLEIIRKLAETQASLASNVHALMWMTFGLGVTLTLYGLRMLTRPNLDFHPSPPIGSIREVFEKPE